MKNYMKPLLTVLALATLAGGGLFYNHLKALNNPPFLSFLSDSSLYQATVLNRSNGFLRFDTNDVNGWDDPSGRSVDLQANTHFYYADEDLKIEDLLDSIRPVLYNEIVILYYSSNENETGLNQGDGFYSYPDISEFVVGDSDSADIYGFSNEENFEIPAYRPFMIVSKMASKIYSKHANIYEENDRASTDYTFDNPLSGNTTGWVMATVEGDDLGFLEDYKNILESVYLQNDENTFDEVDLDSLADTTVDEYYILWLKIKEVDPECDDGIDNDNDGDVDYPDDKGCSSSTDDNESDHPSPGAPIVTSPSDKVLSYEGGTITVSFPGQTGLTYDGNITLYPKGTTTPDLVNTVTANGSTVTIAYKKMDIISGVEDGDEFTLTIPKDSILSEGDPALESDVTFEFTVKDAPFLTSIPVILKPASKKLNYSGGTIIVDFPEVPAISYSGSGIKLTPKEDGQVYLNFVKDVTESGSTLEIEYSILKSSEVKSFFTLTIPKNSVIPALETDATFEFSADISPVYELLCPIGKYIDPAGGYIAIAFPLQIGKTLTYSKIAKISLIGKNDQLLPDKISQNKIEFTNFVVKIPYAPLVDKDYILTIPKDAIKSDGKTFLPGDLTWTWDTTGSSTQYQNCEDVT